MSDNLPTADRIPPSEKVKQFPNTPGVYLMKDEQGRVIYVGKAKHLRNRASHYFTKIAAEEPRTADLVKLIADIDFIPADSEVDALLMEARLVKDVQPRFNIDLKDDKILSSRNNASPDFVRTISEPSTKWHDGTMLQKRPSISMRTTFNSSNSFLIRSGQKPVSSDTICSLTPLRNCITNAAAWATRRSRTPS